jgi:hypothetical protein
MQLLLFPFRQPVLQDNIGKDHCSHGMIHFTT